MRERISNKTNVSKFVEAAYRNRMMIQERSDLGKTGNDQLSHISMQIDEGRGQSIGGPFFCSLRTGLETWFFLLEEASTINKKRPGSTRLTLCPNATFSLSLSEREFKRRELA